jgi:signal transduction histidine kinase/energy-coupling factor transporter ATP-binding protein EcfA2
MPDEISFENLCRECGFEDERFFMKFLRKSGFPTTDLSRQRPVRKRLANDIARALGREINWYPYKQRERDQLDRGPLELLTLEKMEHLGTDFAALVDEWFTRLGYQEVAYVADQAFILGIACAGGYLRGNDDDVFTLVLSRGVNILIGPRGSGKSTILSHLGIMADSMTAKTSVLMEAVVTALSSEKKDLPPVSRRIREIMKSYDTQVLALYCASSGKIYCVLVDLPRSVYGVLEHKKGEQGDSRWIPVEQAIETVVPSILFFKQGEVVRIADADKPHYLNNILDIIYPHIQQQRTELAKHLKNLLIKYGQYKKSGQLREDDDTSIVAQSAWDYLSDRRKELEVIRADFGNETLSERSRSLIKAYVSSAQSYRTALADTPVRTLLEEKAYDALYVGRILGFLQNALDSDTKPLKPSRVVHFLDTRLRFFLSWLKVYGNQRVTCTEQLAALALSYRSVLQKRLALLEAQQKACQEIDNLINRINVHGRRTGVCTPRAEELAAQDERTVEDLKNPQQTYQRLIGIKVRDSSNEARLLAEQYDRSINKMLRELEYLAGDDEAQKKFVFHPISIRFLLNNRFMDFYKLSFGQKCGLILNIVLSVSKAKVFLLDQPEDHLDALGINEMLVPMLLNLGASGQVVIASHSLSLVLGVQSPRVAVLEPCGSYGRLQLDGPAQHPRVLKAMLEVLEGGEKVFEAKLIAFEHFVTRTGVIHDTEIGMIESSFRRRTIEELRSSLQPVICDRFLLDSFRHDLKNIRMTRQSDLPGTLDCEIQCVREATHQAGQTGQPADLLGNVRVLCEQLELHIRHLDKAINDIRMLDTQPQKRVIDCYEALATLKAEILALPQFRARSIDFKLDTRLKGRCVLADSQHLALVFRNLLYNSLRATENRHLAKFRERVRARHSGQRREPDLGVFSEKISIMYESQYDTVIFLLYQDNGCGIPESILNRLYVEHCTTHPQKGDHGWGGVIIKKLLELNGGDISIIETVPNNENRMGTTQRIVLPCADSQA